MADLVLSSGESTCLALIATGTGSSYPSELGKSGNLDSFLMGGACIACWQPEQTHLGGGGGGGGRIRILLWNPLLLGLAALAILSRATSSRCDHWTRPRLDPSRPVSMTLLIWLFCLGQPRIQDPTEQVFKEVGVVKHNVTTSLIKCCQRPLPHVNHPK